MSTTKKMQIRARLKRKMSCVKFKCIYHYTKGINICKIIASRKINLENSTGYTKDERIIKLMKRKNFVWLTESNVYPTTALPYIPSMSETYMPNHFGAIKPTIDWEKLANHIGGIFRFRFNASDVRFDKWTLCEYRKSNLMNPIIYALEESSNLVGDNIHKFWISKDHVQLRNCDLEMLVNGSWVSLFYFDANGKIHQKSNFEIDYFLTKSKKIRAELGLI